MKKDKNHKDKKHKKKSNPYILNTQEDSVDEFSDDDEYEGSEVFSSDGVLSPGDTCTSESYNSDDVSNSDDSFGSFIEYSEDDERTCKFRFVYDNKEDVQKGLTVYKQTTIIKDKNKRENIKHEKCVLKIDFDYMNMSFEESDNMITLKLSPRTDK